MENVVEMCNIRCLACILSIFGGEERRRVSTRQLGAATTPVETHPACDLFSSTSPPSLLRLRASHHLLSAFPKPSPSGSLSSSSEVS